MKENNPTVSGQNLPIATAENMSTPGNVIQYPDGRYYRVAPGGNLERVLVTDHPSDESKMGVVRVVRSSKAEKKAMKRRRHAMMRTHGRKPFAVGAQGN